MCQCDYRHVIRLEYEIFPINFEMNIQEGTTTKCKRSLLSPQPPKKSAQQDKRVSGKKNRTVQNKYA